MNIKCHKFLLTIFKSEKRHKNKSRYEFGLIVIRAITFDNALIAINFVSNKITVKILKFGTPQTIAIIVLRIEKFDETMHQCIQKMLMEWQTA